MVIAKTASRNVAFKVAKMREAIMEDQDEFLMRNSEHTNVGLEANNRAQLEEVAQNADLYIANQEANINILTCNMQLGSLTMYMYMYVLHVLPYYQSPCLCIRNSS